MTATELKVHVNLAGITGRVQIALQKVTNLVAIGLQQAESIQGQSFDIPGASSHYQFNANNEWPVELAKANWQTWILRNGFRDASEVVAGILEEAQSVLSFWRLAVRQAQGEALTVSDWHDHNTGNNQFHRRTLPQKIEYLAKHHGFSLDATLERQIRSINAARNCLVHRDGIVSSQDIDATGALVVEWTGLATLVYEDGREVEITPPHYFEKGAELHVAMRPRQRTFQLGEHVVFTPTEFADICWTVFVLAQSTATILERQGRGLGIPFSTPEA